MIRDFEAWNANIGELSELQELSGCKVAIEAAHYLQHRILSHPRAREPLVPALGGLPLGMKQWIEEDLNTFESLQIEPWFVFSGLDIARPDDPFQQKQREAGVNTLAWNLYDSNQAEASVAKFGESTYVTPEDLFRFLQSILIERGVYFQIAPYSAWAQLAYLAKESFVDAISGSSEILLFECDKIITSWNLGDKNFSWTKRAKCIADLERFAGSGRITEDNFVDALLLAGTPFLPTLPNLSSPNRTELLKPHAAIKMITMSSGRSGYSVVVTNKDDPRNGDYVDRYQKARLAVKNHPILTVEGKVETLNSSQMPSDANQFLGQHLSDELHFLQSEGIINSRLLQWRTSCEIFEQPPIDGGMSPEYQKLVTSKITPLRTAALSLLSTPLHHWYRVKGLDQTCWFPDAATGKPQKKEISMRGLPEYQAMAETWNVKEATFRDVVSSNEGSGPLGSAILALASDDFVAKTVAKKDTNNLLSTPDEVLYNSIWRFLAVREYVDAKHNLTPWGVVLWQTIASLDNAELEESAVLAVELLRLEDLNGDISMFPYNGAPMRGNAKDQHANMLISRVAALGTLQHKPIGFTGPLSQHLLGYGSVVNLVRQTLRDLVEATTTNMFLTGCCDRKTSQKSLITKLPFLLPNNCALGIGVKSYLDELTNDPDPTSHESKARVIETVSTRYFPQSVDFEHDLRTAFSLWDAIFAGVKGSGNKISQQNKTLWIETNDWLKERR
ncbi:hypothetical protein E8E12_006634 [Didymella heteroderae]|uniref:XPG-I domain-containing protein n=1 Tax=Didymella heteroderae TaxID=1769908 RepID=A0A9P4WNF4_9PLEO|nr:hypothetical protein E8E12_006634 [Didymella heteroderae]